MLPAVSVLMPVRNAGRYVAGAIGSILGGSFTDLEFVIVDDGSTDRSRALCERYARQDPRVRVIDTPSPGLVAALNAGLAQCRGEFVARMDADDASLPERLERQVAYLRAHPDCVAVGCRVREMDPWGTPLGLRDLETSHPAIEALLLSGSGGALIHPSMLVRREVFLAVGGYREGLATGEDHDLLLRLALAGRLANLPDVLLHYRMHAANRSLDPAYLAQVRRERTRIVAEAFQARGRVLPEDWVLHVPAPRSAAERYREWTVTHIECRQVFPALRTLCYAVRHEPGRWVNLRLALRLPGVWLRRLWRRPGGSTEEGESV